MSVVSSCQETTWTIQLQVYGWHQELDFFVFSDTLSVRPTLGSSCKNMRSSCTCLSRLLNGEEDCNQSILSVCCTSTVILSFCILLYIILYSSCINLFKTSRNVNHSHQLSFQLGSWKLQNTSCCSLRWPTFQLWTSPHGNPPPLNVTWHATCLV